MKIEYDEETDAIIFRIKSEGTEVVHRETPQDAQLTAVNLVRRLQYAEQLDPEKDYGLLDE